MTNQHTHTTKTQSHQSQKQKQKTPHIEKKILESEEHHHQKIKKDSLFPSNVTGVINEIQIPWQVGKRVQQIYQSQKKKKQI